MNYPITKKCSKLNEEHLAYLHSLTTPEAIVWVMKMARGMVTPTV